MCPFHSFILLPLNTQREVYFCMVNWKRKSFMNWVLDEIFKKRSSPVGNQRKHLEWSTRGRNFDHFSVGSQPTQPDSPVDTLKMDY